MQRRRKSVRDITIDSVLRTDDGAEYVIVPGGRAYAGGYGKVYRAAAIGGGRKTYAVKFMLSRNDGSLPRSKMKAALEGNIKRFENEIEHLRLMNKAAADVEAAEDDFIFPFPRYYGRGMSRGLPFYVMEWLDPINYLEIDTDVERVAFVRALCDAVRLLHRNGFVHYDIKPSNIMRRPRSGTPLNWEYVLSDFGSIHKIEASVEERCLNAPNSVSCLPNGERYVVPNTPGYADPLEDLHTINGDIYAVGQVIRDLFAADVPPHWSPIIFRCISRNRDYRYSNMLQIKEDVRKMVHSAPVFLTNAFAELTGPEGLAWTEEKRHLYVRKGAKKGNGTEKHPFATIGDAVKTAESGEIIEVGAGVYRESVVLAGKQLCLIAPDGALKTEIHGEPRKSVVEIKSGAGASIIKGFKLTGGIGTPCPSAYGFDYYGGGLKSEVSALVEDCIIEGNGKGMPKKSACTFGGGAFVSDATVTFRNCLVRDNFAWACGGGLMAAGGGGTLVIDNCTVEENDSTMFVGGRKGGIALTDHGILMLAESVVRKNGGDQIGGFGVYAVGTRAQVEDSLIEGGAAAKDIERFIAGNGNKTASSKQTAAWGSHFE